MFYDTQFIVPLLPTDHLKYWLCFITIQENVIKIYLDFTESMGN